jgi:hypothetical protein
MFVHDETQQRSSDPQFEQSKIGVPSKGFFHPLKFEK